MATKGDIEAVALLTGRISSDVEEVPSSHDTDALLSDIAISDSEHGERKDAGESSFSSVTTATVSDPLDR